MADSDFYEFKIEVENKINLRTPIKIGCKSKLIRGTLFYAYQNLIGIVFQSNAIFTVCQWITHLMEEKILMPIYCFPITYSFEKNRFIVILQVTHKLLSNYADIAIYFIFIFYFFLYYLKAVQITNIMIIWANVQFFVCNIEISSVNN